MASTYDEINFSAIFDNQNLYMKTEVGIIVSHLLFYKPNIVVFILHDILHYLEEYFLKS